MVEGKADGRRYHHGTLKEAILEAAGTILAREGLAALTLRGAARAAGVSHAAPKNHFGGLAGLLSELAARGFDRLRAALAAEVAAAAPGAAMNAAGRAYVRFAAADPALFQLMFRSERLNRSHPALRESAGALMETLGAAVRSGEGERASTEDHVAAMTLAWAQAHGLALLLIDGRLKPMVGRLPGTTEEAFVARLLGEDGAR
jgi:AcrR family transcriptional regulator